jgi:hypothetical protein
MECETRVTSEVMTSGGRDLQAPVTEHPPLDNSQLSVCDAHSPCPTELEITLATPDLSPKVKKFLGQKKFQNVMKVMPSNILTMARRGFHSHYIHITNIVTGITAQRTGVCCTQLVLKANSITSGPCWTRTLLRYI